MVSRAYTSINLQTILLFSHLHNHFLSSQQMIQNFQDEVCFVLDTMKGMTMAAKNDSVVVVV